MNWDPGFLLAEGPLRSLRIGGTDHPVGKLSLDWIDHYEQEYSAAVEMRPGSVDPYHAVRGLLEAGNPDLDWSAVRPHLTRDVIPPATREVCRQSIKAKLEFYDTIGILSKRGREILGAAHA